MIIHRFISFCQMTLALLVLSLAGNACQPLNLGQNSPSPFSSPTVSVNLSTLPPPVQRTGLPLSADQLPSLAAALPTQTEQEPPQKAQTSASSTPSAVNNELIVCSKSKGKVETQNWISQAKDISEFKIYLPPCYARESAVAYPVLFLLHGMGSNDQQWPRIGVPSAVDYLIQSGQIQPLLIVFPNEVNSTQWIDHSTFGQSLVQELVPWINEHYSVCPLTKCRAVGGLSRGADWAMRIGFNNWKVFGAVGGHSVSPFYGDLDGLKDWISLSPESGRPRVFLDSGTYDQALPDAKTVEKLLTRFNVDHQWLVRPGAHNEDYWKAHLAEYLIWYNQGWPPVQ